MSNHKDLLTAAFDQVKKDVRSLTDRKTYEHLNQNQVITALTVALLLVGVVTGVYLGGQNAENRQIASTAYPFCTNTSGQCSGLSIPGSTQCTLPLGGTGTCDNSSTTNGICTCTFIVTPTATPMCKANGAVCSTGQVCCNGLVCDKDAGRCAAPTPIPTGTGNCVGAATGGSQQAGVCKTSCDSGSEVIATDITSACSVGTQKCCIAAPQCSNSGGRCDIGAGCTTNEVENPNLVCPNSLEAICCMPQATPDPTLCASNSNSNCLNGSGPKHIGDSCINTSTGLGGTCQPFSSSNACVCNPGQFPTATPTRTPTRTPTPTVAQCSPVGADCSINACCAGDVCLSQNGGSGRRCVAMTPTPTIGQCKCGANSDGQCIGEDVNSPCTSGGHSFVCGAGSTGLQDPDGGYYCTCSSIPSPFCGGTNACANPTQVPVSACGTGGCTSCQHLVNLVGTNGASCGSICQNDNTCSGCTNVTFPPATNTPVPTGVPTNPPQATNTPMIGPICAAVTVNNPGSTSTIPAAGDAISLTCAPVINGDHYEFTLTFPGGSVIALSPSAIKNISQQFVLPQSSMGQSIVARCRPCDVNNLCPAWE